MKHNWGCLVFFIPLTILAQLPALYVVFVNGYSPMGHGEDSVRDLENFQYLFLTTIFDLPIVPLWIAYFFWARKQAVESIPRRS